MLRQWVFASIVFLLLAPVQLEALETEVNCGEIVEGEFRRNSEVHSYVIRMEAGERLKFATQRVGDFLEFAGYVTDPVNQTIWQTDRWKTYAGLDASVGVLSAPGNYKVFIQNYGRNGNQGGRIGLYTLHIGCVRADGAEIRPGEPAESEPMGAAPPAAYTASEVPPTGSAGGALGDVQEVADEVQGTVGEITSTANQVADTIGQVQRIASSFKSIGSLFGGGKKRKKRLEEERRLQEQAARLAAERAALDRRAQALAAPQAQGNLLVPSPSGSTGQGQAASPPSAVAGPPPPQPAVVFPTLGLDVDLSSVLPAAPGAPPFGFHFQGQEARPVRLDCRRTAGNLTMSIVLTGPDGQPLLQGLVAEAELSQQIVLPAEGSYTVKIQRVDLVPVEDPQDTAFTVSVVGQ